MLKNERLPYLGVPYTWSAMSFQADTIYAYLEMKLAPRNWPAKTMDMNSEMENTTMLSMVIQQTRQPQLL